jgi:hypothetical protein
VLSYRVIGGVRVYEEGDQVWWKAIPPDHNFPIRSAIVTVMLPQLFSMDELVVDAYGATVDSVSYTDRGAVRFTATDIPKGQELEVRVQFPHGVLQASPPAWQSADDLRREWGPVVTLLFGALGLMLLVGSPIVVYWLWYVRGRDEDSWSSAGIHHRAPDTLPAGVVGTLVDEHADVKDIVATIFDLAERGAIRMEEKQNLGSLGMSRDFVFYLENPDLATYPHEKRLLKHIFSGSRQERRLYDMRQKFYHAIPKLQNDLYKHGRAGRLFPLQP